MRAALDAFDQQADAIVRDFVQTIEVATPPPMLHHYTNAAGLQGILASGHIWLSDTFRMNDPSEVEHGCSIAAERLSNCVTATRPETEYFARGFEAFLTQGGVKASGHFFSASFSGDSDDLGQWRAYGDNGRGFALAFDGKTLEDAFTQLNGVPIPNNSTFPTTYNDAQLRGLCDQIVTLADPLISVPRGGSYSNRAINAYMQELSVILSMHLVRLAMFFKHEAYRHELEYRFLQLFRADLPPPQAKQRGTPPIKYREFDWRTLCAHALRRVVVGPGADFGSAESFVEACLKAGPYSAEIVRSKIPYR
jgi:hypothetical protein